jgi:uncharacterized membrane protein YphA (DoxX/SURF4 family)
MNQDLLIQKFLVMEKILKILFTVCRVALGLVFIFSGFVKGVDPLGSAYKFNDYFMVVGIPQLDTIPLIMSYLLSGAEFLIGVALVTGIFINLTAWTAIFFMGFFTILTFLLAVFNPVTDCGCFGDAIKLTNWETFYKNIVFSIFVLFIFLNRKRYKVNISKWFEWITLSATITFFSFVFMHSYRHLPIIDFISYSIGSNIPEKMIIPKDAPIDEYETRMIYKNKKSEEIKEFTLQNYPWKDTINWQWAETKSVLTKKGYTPPIHDFSITNPLGENITDQILNDTGYCFLFIAYNINKANEKALQQIDTLETYCSATKRCSFYAITASTASDVTKLKYKLGLNYDFNNADETAMKTVIRSNPGLVLLKNGTVVGKWHYNDLGKLNLKKTDFVSNTLSELRSDKEWYLALTLLFALGFFSCLVRFWLKR